MAWAVIEKIIVVILLMTSAFYLGWRAYRAVFKKKADGCICDGCPSSASCSKKK